MSVEMKMEKWVPGEGYSPEGLVRSERYSEVMNAEVIPYLRAHRTDTVTESAGCALFTSVFVPDGGKRGTVTLVHGFTENLDKYAELIHSLLRFGWCVLAYDQRGHGRSGRKAGITDLSLTHVDRFDAYVEDLRRVIDLGLKDLPKPHVLFSHSMGGAVSALYMEEGGDAFSRAVFSSPMISPNLGGVPQPLVRAVCRVPILLGRGTERAFVSKPYTGPEDFETSCASGRERFEWYEQLRAATPAFQNNGPSYAWALEAMKVPDRLLAAGMPERITIPARVYGAENDTSVLPGPQQAFARRLPNGAYRVVPGSRHEICRSPDSVVFPWWSEVLAFIGGE